MYVYCYIATPTLEPKLTPQHTIQGLSNSVNESTPLIKS